MEPILIARKIFFLLLFTFFYSILRDKAGFTPLLRACARGSAKVVSLLVDSGADEFVETNNKSTALHQAAASGITFQFLLFLVLISLISQVMQQLWRKCCSTGFR